MGSCTFGSCLATYPANQDFTTDVLCLEEWWSGDPNLPSKEYVNITLHDYEIKDNYQAIFQIKIIDPNDVPMDSLYYVVYSGDNSCNSGSTTGINNNELVKDQKRNPVLLKNPVNDYLTIDTKERAIIEYSIIDINGHVLKTERNKWSKMSILNTDVSNLIKGIYFIRFKTFSGNTITSKFIKE